jgi:hypothetical protein
MTTSFIGFRSAIGSVRSAVSIDGSGFWVGGYYDTTVADGGVVYISRGASGGQIRIDNTSYKAGIIQTDIYWSDNYAGWNYIGYMNISSYNYGRSILLNPINQTSKAANIMGFVFVSSGYKLFLCDYGVGLRSYLATSIPYSGLNENINPTYPSTSVLSDSKNVFGIAAFNDLLYISTPSAVYVYNYGTMSWANGGEYILLAVSGTEFRGISMAPSTPTASSSSSHTSSSTSSQTSTASRTASSSQTATSSDTSSSSSTSSATATASQTSTSSVSAIPKPIVFNAANAYQYITVPSNIVQGKVLLWGAGGGAGGGISSSNAIIGNGGNGAFVSGYLPIFSGETLRLIIGQGGSSTSNYTADWLGGISGLNGGSGGGRTAIQRNKDGIWTDIVVAAGGGGSSGYYGPPPPGYWRTSGYGGNGGIESGCDATYEAPINGMLTSVYTEHLGGNQTSNGVGGNDTCLIYGSGGGGGYYNGAASCFGGGGGGSSFIDLLTEATESSGLCFSARVAGSMNSFYRLGISKGGSRTQTTGGNGLIVIQWTWPVFFTPSSTKTGSTATPTFNTLSATASSGSSPSASVSMSSTSTQTAAVQQLVARNHLVCSMGSINAPSVDLACPEGSIMYSIDFAACGTYTGKCGSLQRGNCNMMPRMVVQLLQDTCVGSANCSFTGPQLCSQASALCINEQPSYIIQGSCMPGTKMINNNINTAVARSVSITPQTVIRYIRLSSTAAISDGEMGFSELEVISNAGVNIALYGNATSSSTRVGSYGINDYDICGADSNIPSAAIDGDRRCTFAATNHDPFPWWQLDLGTGVPINSISKMNIYARQPYDDNDGYSHDPSYQIDSAILTLADEDGNMVVSNDLPWLSVLPRPFSINVSQALSILLDYQNGYSISYSSRVELDVLVAILCVIISLTLWFT